MVLTARRIAVWLHRTRRARYWSLAFLLIALLGGRSDAEEAREAVVAQATEDEAAEANAEEEGDEGVEDSAGVEVMHVRGRTAAAIETEVPASITQFDASTIQALGAQDISDLSRVTPNVNIVQPGATQATFFVRGIGLSDFSANAAGAVTILQDSVALNAPAIQTGQLFDVRDVEIVRGPQGTGAFRNASGGAIRVSSNLPTGNYGGYLRTSFGRYAADGGQGAHHGRIQDYEGFLEAPVVPDLISTRLAFRLRKADPYQTNGCGDAIPFSQREPRPSGGQQELLDERDICGERGQAMWPTREISRIPVGLDSKVDIEDNWAARGFWRLKPPDSELDIVFNLHGSRLDEDQTYGQAIGTGRIVGRAPFFGGGSGSSGTPGYQEPDQRAEIEALCENQNCSGFPNPIITNFGRILAEARPLDREPYRGDYNRDGITQRDTWGGFLQAKGELWDQEWFVVGSYDAYERFRDQDTDFTPDVLFEVIEDDRAWQRYFDAHVDGELDLALFEWQVGVYYLKEKLDSEAVTELASENRIERNFNQNTEAVGPWAKFKWDFLDDVTLEAGARWNWEHKEFGILRRLSLSGSNSPASVADQEKTWDTTTANVILTYHLNESASAFAKYTRGFKAGHFNALASEDVARPPAEPEYNDAWEAGLAGSWLNHRFSGSVSYFYYRYTDYQIFLFRSVALDPPVLEIINAAEAENYGVEVEGQFLPLRGWAPRIVENLLITANFGWLHGEFLDFQLRNTLPVGGDSIPITLDFSGDQLLNSPEFKVAGSATWTFELGRWGSIIPRYDFSWTDDVFYGLNEGRGTAPADVQGNPRLPDFAVGQPAYWLHNVRLAYRTPTGNVEVGIFCRNLEDEVYKNFAFDASNFSNVVLNFVGTPRTIGLDVIVSF